MSIRYFPGAEGITLQISMLGDESSLIILTTALAGPWQNTSNLSLSLWIFFCITVCIRNLANWTIAVEDLWFLKDVHILFINAAVVNLIICRVSL
jgi:hypothetical protein